MINVFCIANPISSPKMFSEFHVVVTIPISSLILVMSLEDTTGKQKKMENFFVLKKPVHCLDIWFAVQTLCPLKPS